MTRLPPILGGAPTQPLHLGRSTRVITPAQRTALAVRDGGCVFGDCARPLAWCEGHHLVSWLDGGPTDLPNLALLCRAHHRAVHEGSWRPQRDPDGRFMAIPPYRRDSSARRQAATTDDPSWPDQAHSGVDAGSAPARSVPAPRRRPWRGGGREGCCR